MSERLDALNKELTAALSEAGGDLATIEKVRVRFLGKKGSITALMKNLGLLDASERPAAGQAINELKNFAAMRIEEAKRGAATRAMEEQLDSQREDVTLPAVSRFRGALHPITHTRRELERIFRDLGYHVETGPEVEDDFHNFQALNMPAEHPARDAQDTFYLTTGHLLRTHTSPVQIRTMKRRQPPFRMICPGRVYRRDYDATHLPMFHQLEALVIDKNITMADLKQTMALVWKLFFGSSIETRLRPGYFPFVEPGCEYDISCQVCDGRGCRICKGTGWIELGGAGMVHPAVFETAGIDAEKFTGFAFGLGIDRIAAMRHGIEDLRLMLENDVRFLNQFSV